MIASTVRPEWPLVLAATVRFTRNLELAEVATEAAFARASADDSVTRLTGLARAAALDLLRRDLTYVSDLPLIVIADKDGHEWRRDVARDDRRALAYMAAHPALAIATRMALMLRLMGGLTVGEIAVRLDEEEVVTASRLSSARRQIRAEGIPFETASDTEFASRVRPVLARLAEKQLVPCDASADTEICASWAKRPQPWRENQLAVANG